MGNYKGSFERLIRILDDLRTNCPWDKKQTIHSLRQLTIEETYELVDAITAEDWTGIKEELGDLLLHILFYAKIAEEQSQFGIENVVESVCNKLVHRHPHIYDSTVVENDEDVKRNWEKLKLKEGKRTVLSGVPNSLPSMIKALRLQEKAKQVGFEWEVTEQVKEKLMEELDELQEVVEIGDEEKMKNEFGDVLFSMINYARFLNIDPEDALARTNNKFQRRFNLMENQLTKDGNMLTDFNLQQMDEVWNEIKRNEK
ncbi:MAG TPA: nucleoside triphosphate pyrophosphohydrolase [Chitinophagaceae bacterium]|nr:nucleoside triphosphate pyrophosphohydrolase [Chitinophagaceae bacterium]